MKVEGPSKSGKTNKSKKAGTKKTGDSSFGDMVSKTGAEDKVEGTAGLSGIASVAGLDALLSLQEASDTTSEEAKSRAKKRGNQILEYLDRIRLGLLMGGISVGDLKDLARVISEHREDTLDPELANIMDEIELRAAVELAKFEQG